MPLRLPMPDYASAIAMLLATAPAVAEGPSVGPLPVLAQSLMAYVSFFGTLLLAIGWIWKAAKEKARMEEHERTTTERLDGFGGRLDSYEAEQTRSIAREQEWIRSLERVLSANENLVQSVARAGKSAEQCESSAEQWFRELAVKFDAMTKELSDNRRIDGERLRAVETRLDYSHPKP